jgi:integrase
MPERPFSGQSIYKVSLELTTKLTARIPALPDMVAIPLMNSAHKFIAMASDDLIRAVQGLFEVRETLSLGDGATMAKRPKVIKFFQDFRFSTPLHATFPWHEQLGIRGTPPGEELRRLVDELIDACVITAQAETGMRIGEISALLAGMNEQTGLPACITVRPSKSGMLDLYYLTSTLTKLRPVPVDEEWLLAAAPRGKKELPDAVRAIVVLQKLLAPIRAFANPEIGKYLIVTMGVPRGFPTSAAGITEPNNHLLRLGQKGFARSFVDWDEVQLTEETRPYIESRGNCIRTHQWRKTYAQYVFQVDKKMLPAISRQFKHLSLAMTEGAYVGTSASLVTGIAEFNRNLTADSFLAKVRGTASKQEGRLAKLMAQYLPELRKIVEGFDENGARLAIDTWCRSRDMKIFFHGYGQCIPAVAPLKAECHKRAQTVHWANKAPNYAHREPSVCTGCSLFMTGEQNIDHWTKRYVENKVIWLKATAEGRGDEFRVAKTRAEQAKGYLSSLGAEIPKVETTELEMTHEG